MRKQFLKEVKQFQKIAGILKEDQEETLSIEDFFESIYHTFLEKKDFDQIPKRVFDRAVAYLDKHADQLTPTTPITYEDVDKVVDFILNKVQGVKETWHPDDPSQPGDDGPETDPDDFDDVSEGSEEAQGSKITDDEGIAYDMTDGISLPYDGFRTANKFKKVANGLGMKEGPAQYELTGEHAGDYYFVYEDDDEATSPDFIVILNPTMQNNEMIRTLVKKCLNQYGNM